VELSGGDARSGWRIIDQPNIQENAMGVNSVTLVGRAGRDPEVRYFESGSMVANLTIAVNRRSRDDEPDWFNLEIWGKQAQVAADYVRKGSLLGIIGSFKLDRWTDRASGEERSKPVVRVDRLELLGSKRDAEGGGFGGGGGGGGSFGGGEPSEEEVPF
jgi:single-strand DNA-binding protein